MTASFKVGPFDEHDDLSALTFADVGRVMGRYGTKIQEGANKAGGAVRGVHGELEMLSPASVEYALAITEILTREEMLINEQFGKMMGFIERIRPPSTGGRMAPAPEHFGGKWPHQRLGHKTWSAFVKAKPGGKMDWEKNRFKVGPGLGWSPRYERDLFRGYERVRKLVAIAMPEATVMEAKQTVVTALDGAGADVTAGAVAHLAAGEADARDVARRGMEALVDPLPVEDEHDETTVDRVALAVAAVARVAPADLVRALPEATRQSLRAELDRHPPGSRDPAPATPWSQIGTPRQKVDGNHNG